MRRLTVIRKVIYWQKSKEYLTSFPEYYFCNIKNLDKLKLELSKKLLGQPIDNSDLDLTFLVGFPRSGTTLLDTILQTHSKIVVAEEKPLLQAVRNFLNNSGYNDFVELVLPSNIKVSAQVYKNYKHIKIDPCTSYIDIAFEPSRCTLIYRFILKQNLYSLCAINGLLLLDTEI